MVDLIIPPDIWDSLTPKQQDFYKNNGAIRGLTWKESQDLETVRNGAIAEWNRRQHG